MIAGTVTNVGLPTECEAIEIARAEMSRRSKRLGKLTPEQELVIEDMLIQTVNRISKLTGRVLEALPSVA
jgi:hypothetical protein